MYSTKKSIHGQSSTESAPGTRLVIFDTHPIQYRSPIFVALYKLFPNLIVHYFNDSFDGGKWWFHEVGKIPPQNWALPLRTGFPNDVLGTAKWNLWWAYRRFRKILSEEKPAAVVIYGYYLPEHWILRLLCKKFQIPVLFVGETFAEANSKFRKLLREPGLRFFFRGVSQFIAIGNRTQQFYKTRKISEKRITEAKYCIDTSFFSLPAEEAKKDRESVRTKLGIPQDAFVLLFVGRLFERKRPEDVLALHEKMKANPKFYTVVVGNGPLEKKLREQNAHTNRLLFVGFKNQVETRAFYNAADLLYVPSVYETWGLVVNEAAACGLPALVTDTCGVAGDLVVNNETGFVCPVGDVSKAFSVVKTLTENPALLKTLSENTKKKVDTEYRADLFAAAMLNAFKSAISRPLT